MPENALRRDRERLITNIRVAATVRRARPFNIEKEGKKEFSKLEEIEDLLLVLHGDGQ